MKNKRLYGFFLAVLTLFAACNAPEKKNPEEAELVSSTLPAGIDARLLEKFKTIRSLPFVADTTLMFHLETCDSLGTKEIKQLDKNWFVRDSSSSEAYAFKEFYMIDSIKASGTYSAWCDSLQPGMTKSANAYAVGKIVLDSKEQLLVWGLTNSSYEACPVSATQNIYVSILKEGVLLNTFKLAEYGSFADPPVAMQRIVTGTINKDLTVNINEYQENDEDMDLPELTVTKANYRLTIKNEKITTLSEKKEEPVKVKRKN